MIVLDGNFGPGCGPGTDYPWIRIFQCILERTGAVTNEVLEPITFLLAYPTVFTVSLPSSKAVIHNMQPPPPKKKKTSEVIREALRACSYNISHSGFKRRGDCWVIFVSLTEMRLMGRQWPRVINKRIKTTEPQVRNSGEEKKQSASAC